jgi:hypothetical protein
MLPDFESHAARFHDPLELRATPRVAIDIPVDLYTSDIRGALPGRARDIGIEGACIATASPFAIKSVQKVVFSLQAGSLTVDAVGAWQRDANADELLLTGLQFEHPSAADLDRLWSLVFASGRTLARFLYEKTPVYELGLEDAFGLAQLTRYREIPVGRAIYRQDVRETGDDSLFFLMEGCVVLQTHVRDGVDIEIERIEAGGLFGGFPLLTNAPPTESAIAATPTRLLEIDAPSFQHLRLTKPWLAYRLSHALFRISSLRLQRLFEKVRDSR